MSHSFNQRNLTDQQNISIAPSMISYKDYYMRYIRIKETQLENEWGWFIDLELNSEPFKLNKDRKKLYKNYLH